MTKRNYIVLPALLLATLGSFTLAAADPPLSLAGRWRFQLDRADAGVSGRWFARPLPDTIKLPGGLTEQGIGDPVSVATKWIGSIVDQSWYTEPRYAKYRAPGNVKVPFWLTPEKYYAGAAWYQRDIEIPQDWHGHRVVLSLERPHWETRVWVDNQLIGTNNALATPHDYDLGQLAPGKHTLTIRVDNRMVLDVGENSHSISDHTQGNWNGIVGRIELRATPLVWIADLQIHPRIASKSVIVRGRLGNATGKTVTNSVGLGLLDRFDARPRFPTTNVSVVGTREGGVFEAEVVCGNPVLPWDEFRPRLYELTAQVGTLPDTDSQRVFFGFREITTQGTQFLLNGRKTFFRGTLDCCIYPLTGHPPTDVESWRHVIQSCKAHGLNLIRFHSWCPPEAAFIAADELGFYLHVEASSWANASTTLGDGKPVDDWIYAETDRILKYYGNHPSFMLMPYGNEPGGKQHAAYLVRWVNHYKAQDARRLWTSGAGWPQIPENQFHVVPDPRVQGWGEGLKSRINARPPETTTDYRDYINKRTVPVISHEIGQWCVYPNFDEIKKYTGYLKPLNFEIFRDTLETQGLGDLAKKFLLASGKLQTLCYKEDIESALRTPGMGGFELLDLHDFPGQGTALVGVLDPFWEGKGYVTPEEYRRFCNSTVPLARLKQRVFTTEEKLEAEIEAAHYGAAPLENARTIWKLVNEDGQAIAQGELPAKSIPVDAATALGRVRVDLKSVAAPARYQLVVGLANTPFENDWDIWVYPAVPALTPPPNALVTSQFDDAARQHLRAGGKLLLTLPRKHVRNFDVAPVKHGFSTIFWNTAWTERQAPTTLGILCDPEHPALADFPTDFHSNWQWWYLVHRAGALRLDLLPRGLEPIVRVIDDWFTARPLGLVIEAKVGAGKLIACGFDLTRDSDDPVSRQMRASLLRYVGSKEFNPSTEITADQIQSLIAEPKETTTHGVLSAKADSEEEGNEAGNAVDGDPDTIWHTPWGEVEPGFPHELVIELIAPKTLTGFTALPRQDGSHNGWIKDYAIHASTDGRTWGEAITKGTFSNNKELKTVKFKQTVKARFVKLVALSAFDHQPYASLAELSVLSAD